VGGADVSTSAAEGLTTAYGAYGTMVEPNIFGSFTAAFLVLATVLLSIAAHRGVAVPNIRLLRWLAVAAATGLVLSFTRAAWLGAGAALVAFAVAARAVAGVRVRFSRSLVPAGLAVAGLGLMLLLPGNAGDLFRFKVLNLLNVVSPTGALRLLTYAMALDQTAQHPIVGWGTFSFAALAVQGSDFQQFDNWRNLWIGNFLVLALHDTGAVGLALWVGLIATILARGVRAVRVLRRSAPLASVRALALTVAVASLLVPFLATSGFSLGYSWLLIGLLGAHCREPERDATPPHRTPAS
jgi:O-antigen ligase